MCHRPARIMENVIFFTSLHCFIIRKTSINAAGPAGGLLRIHDCSVGDV